MYRTIGSPVKTCLLATQSSPTLLIVVVVVILMAVVGAFRSWSQTGVFCALVFAEENGQASSGSREIKLLQYVLAAIKGKDPRVREEAINALKDFADPRLVMVGIIALGDAAPDVRRAAIELLTNLDDPIARDPIKRLLNDKDPSVRIAAVGALAGRRLWGAFTFTLSCGRPIKTRLYSSAAVPGLIKLLESDPSAEVREEAAYALGRFRDKRVIKPLIKALEEDDLFVRSNVASSLLYLTRKATGFGEEVRTKASTSQKELFDKPFDPDNVARTIGDWKPWWEQNADEFEWDSRPEYKPQLAKNDAILFAPRRFRIEAKPMSLATGDLDGDGLQDVAALTINDNDNERILVLLGKGDGTLAAPMSVAKPFLSWHFWVRGTLRVEDFNGDGILDMLVSSRAEKISLRLLTRGTQNEVMQIKKVDLDIDTGASPALAIADFNDDAILDAAISEPSSPTIAFLLSENGEPLSRQQSWTTGEEPSRIIAGDIDGDKTSDLVITFWKKIALLLGQGDGSFKERGHLTVDRRIGCTLLADFDGDTILDLAATIGDDLSEMRSGKLLVFNGTGDGTFKKAAELVIGLDPTSLVSGDFNGDGNTDLAVLYMEVVNYGGLSDVFSLLLGKGDSTFDQPIDFAVEGPSVNLVHIASGDINGDGVDDIIVASAKDRSLYVFQGRRR